MKIGIVGAGVAGLTAAYELSQAGHAVVLFEAAEQAGGLASGFRDTHWDWHLERYYHHLFETDTAMRQFVQQVGFADKLFFRSPVTAHFWNGDFYAIDGPTRLLRFPGLPFPDRVRFGATVGYLKYVNSDWHSLEQHSAVAWSKRWAGEAAYREVLQPLLEGKFGPYTPEVNMAWLWARFRARSFKLGYFVGGFQAFVDHLMGRLEGCGVRILLNTPVRGIARLVHSETCGQAGWQILTPEGPQFFDQVIVTSSPRLLARLVPQLPTHYVADLLKLHSLGAVVLVLALKRRLTEQLYWIQGMQKEQFPFLALVEHTNFMEPEHYGGDHLIYCGDYVRPDHEYFKLSHEELLERFLPYLTQFNPAFRPDWVRTSWLNRAPYAQPVVGLNHSKFIPPLQTPLPGLFWASMSQVYPWDRGTNFAVELGQRVATEAIKAGA
ncbi:MAG: NAD(P)/FAD-dependent oxidoreductase [Chloroflexaceae bacterium]|nr:NAD(P)/FAD-dependent oxidoreductase [Chloroflexaceae bacterium]